ncbi:rhomboid family intramembrane serine protease [Natronorarus salvus]|uniref:rhomboid family intramembrane serine protease n=1 Tax=Natronorarus salvus TaxID=3117733 RepID=UPI002F263407
MRPPRSPSLETLGIIAAVFAVQQAVALMGIGPELFALAAPLEHRPWTLVTSVYAHAGPTHLLANALGLAVLGLLVERASNRSRFHVFVLLTGLLAGLAEVLFGLLVGYPRMVLGISGAVFALMGYVVAGNPLADSIMGRFRPTRRQQLLIVVVLGGLVTLFTASGGVALVAHFTGFALGLVGGRQRVLRAH